MSATRLRLGFAGSPAFAAKIVAKLIADHDVVVVYCRPARPSGRGRRLQPCAVEKLARTAAIPVESPRSLRTATAASTLADYATDLLIVAAYGLILPAAVLSVPRLGCLNVHASLLPRWRGAAPIERAIMAGDTTTGISIMQMDEGLDTGPVRLQVECAIGESDTGATLHERLAELGSMALAECLSQWPSHPAKPQSECGITYAKKLTAADALLNWHGDSQSLSRTIRALNPRLPAYTFLGEERVRLWSAHPIEGARQGRPGEILEFDRQALVVACGRGALAVTRAQLARGKGVPLDTGALFNGYRDTFRSGLCFANHVAAPSE